MANRIFPITTSSIRLDQFLKWANIAATGGQAKVFIRQGMVKVNGRVETRRSHLLKPGDEVEIQGARYKVSRHSAD
ncbi:hypothetical protein MHOCP_00030 [Moorella humiferrea]|uniref:RNA-binding S4 domain-containing protein n=1 Tax=Neomoorella humiferrea TaxID=676965 RepID=UPI0030CD5BCF